MNQLCMRTDGDDYVATCPRLDSPLVLFFGLCAHLIQVNVLCFQGVWPVPIHFQVSAQCTFMSLLLLTAYYT